METQPQQKAMVLKSIGRIAVQATLAEEDNPEKVCEWLCGVPVLPECRKEVTKGHIPRVLQADPAGTTDNPQFPASNNQPQPKTVESV